MSRIPSSTRILGLLAAGLVLAAPASSVFGAAPQQEDVVIRYEAVLAPNQAGLTLELRDGRELRLILADGRVRVDGEEVGRYSADDELDRAWRALLAEVVGQPTAAAVPALLRGWSPPAGSAGERLGDALAAALVADAPAVDPEPEPDEAVAAIPSPDTLDRLEARIRELERDLARAAAAAPVREVRRDRGFAPLRPVRVAANHIWGVVKNILELFAIYIVLIGLGFAAVLFGHRYLEGVADTARYATTRSGLVGIATLILLLPTFVIGIIALAVSIIGIPLLLVWIFLFPAAAVLAGMFGYLGVAHAAGEALAERRSYKGTLLRPNSYYYILTGIALLLAFFLAAHVVGIAGPWFGFFRGMLSFLGGVLTFLAISIGLGAVVISRGGSQPVAKPLAAEAELDPMFEEETRV